MKKSIVIVIVILAICYLTNFAQETGTFRDIRDKKVYKTVKIGDKTWMAENLAYKAESGCWAYKDSINYVKTYGYLYNFSTANKVCPKGWHLPSLNEWKALIDTLGGSNFAANKLKEKGTTHWYNPDIYATNESGFSALPGGRYYNEFVDIGIVGEWWSSTTLKLDVGMIIYILWRLGNSEKRANENGNFSLKSWNGKDFEFIGKGENNGCSVRCVKD